MKAIRINTNLRHKAAGLFVVLMLSGCIGHIDRTHQSSVHNFSATELNSKLTIGKTTKKEVLLMLGKPAVPEDYNQQNTWIYYSKTQGRAIYLIVPVNYDKSATLVLTFNADKILTGREYKEE